MSHPNYFQVEDLSPAEIRKRIEELLEVIKRDELEIPVIQDNLIYVSGRVRMKPFNEWETRTPSQETCDRVTKILKLLLELDRENKTLTKRGVFYADKKLFSKQNITDSLINDICCLLGATQRSLRITTFPNGFVIGSIVIRVNGKVLNLQKQDVFGKLISTCMSDFEVISCKAKFILVVEKFATYSTLIEENFHKKVGCVLITGKGMPDIATCYFLRNLTKKLENLPVLALVDCDAYGVRILSTYTSGSENLAFDSENLATPSIKWLGVRPSDVEKYGLSDTAYLNDDNIKVAQGLKEKVYFKDKTSWITEINEMLESMRTCDLGSLSSTMVLEKVAEKDWLPGSGALGTYP